MSGQGNGNGSLIPPWAGFDRPRLHEGADKIDAVIDIMADLRRELDARDEEMIVLRARIHELEEEIRQLKIGGLQSYNPSQAFP